MVPLPKRRHSTRRGGKRKAAIKISLPQLVKCPNCNNLKLPHRVCPSCGYYAGQEMLKQKAPKTKSRSSNK